MDEQTGRPRYWAALDGLRGVAAVGVVLFHVRSPGFSGGFVAVDVFFVLSGFLITGVVLDRDDGLRAFWGRRAARLVPALVVYVAVSLLAAATVLRTSDGGHTAGAVVPVLLYVSNWTKAGGVWNLGVFGHTWSLAVEEQFYLVWPVLLVAARRALGSLERVACLAGGLALVAASARFLVYLRTRDVALLFNATPFRADALLTGAVAALVMRRGRTAWRVPRGPAVWASAVLLGVAVNRLARQNSDPALYLGGFTLAAVAAAVVVLRLTDATGPVPRLLASRPLVALGRLSYGIYLWHFLAVAVAEHFAAGGDAHGAWALRLAVVAPLTLAAAMASARFVEQPVLAWRRRRDAERVAGTPAARHRVSRAPAPERSGVAGPGR